MEKNGQFSRKIIRDSFIVSVGSLATKIIGFGSTIIVLYLLSLYEYGLYKLVFAAFGVFSSFLFSGLDQIILSDSSGDWRDNKKGRIKKRLLEFLAIKLFIGFTLWAIVFFGSDSIGKHYGENISNLLKIISFLYIINPIKGVFVFLLNLKLDFKAMSISSVLEEAAKLIFIVISFFLIGLGVNGVIISHLVAALTSLVFLSIFSVPMFFCIIKERADKSFILLDTIKKHGKWGLLTNYSTDIQRNIHPWLIKLFIGTEAVAVVSIAESAFGHITSIFPMAKVLLPVIPREMGDSERIKRIFFRGIKYGTLSFFIIGAVSFFALPYLIETALPKYTSSIPIFRVLVFGVIFTATANMLTGMFYALKMQRQFFISSLIRLPFMIVISFLLYQAIGILGVGIEIVLTSGFFIGSRYYFLARVNPEFSFNFKELFRFDSYDRVLVERFKTYIKTKFLFSLT